MTDGSFDADDGFDARIDPDGGGAGDARIDEDGRSDVGRGGVTDLFFVSAGLSSHSSSPRAGGTETAAGARNGRPSPKDGGAVTGDGSRAFTLRLAGLLDHRRRAGRARLAG